MRNYIDNWEIISPELFPSKFCIKMLPPGTTGYKHSFSQMNIIASEECFRILVSNMSKLLMRHINGPPLVKNMIEIVK